MQPGGGEFANVQPTGRCGSSRVTGRRAPRSSARSAACAPIRIGTRERSAWCIELRKALRIGKWNRWLWEFCGNLWCSVVLRRDILQRTPRGGFTTKSIITRSYNLASNCRKLDIPAEAVFFTVGREFKSLSRHRLSPDPAAKCGRELCLGCTRQSGGARVEGGRRAAAELPIMGHDQAVRESNWAILPVE
jgi:hypothetical protein